MRRRASASLGAHIAHEGSEGRAVGTGIGVVKLLERVRVREHSIAPPFDLGKTGARGVRAALNSGKRRFERFGVDVPHQLADELQLPSSPLVLRNAARLGDCIGQPLRQREFGQPARIQVEQALAECLQLMHRALAFRLGRRLLGTVRVVLSLFGRKHERECKPMRVKRGRSEGLCYDTQHALRTARGALARSRGATFAGKGHP